MYTQGLNLKDPDTSVADDADKLARFQEAMVGDVLGTLIGFGEIRYADGVIEKERP